MIPGLRWRTRHSTLQLMSKRRRKRTVTKITLPRRKTPVIAVRACGIYEETFFVLFIEAICFVCFAEYSASLGSEEESGKDWDELEEEARKGMRFSFATRRLL